jgi:hypothetical protein
MLDVEEAVLYLLDCDDRDKWSWILSNKSALVYLDDNRTFFVVNGDDQDRIIEFDAHIGNSFGV